LALAGGGVARNYLTSIHFFSRMRAWQLLGHGAKDHLSAKKTILDIKKSKRVLDIASRRE
jgi:hypothetical protein